MYFHFCSRGYAEAEIEAVFAKYDTDGDRVLDKSEQEKMLADLDGQKVRKSWKSSSVVINKAVVILSLASLGSWDE